MKDGLRFLDRFQHIKNNTNIGSFEIPISNDIIDYGNFSGFAKNGKSINYIKTQPNYRGFLKLTVTSTPNHNDRFFIGDKNEIEISGYNLGDYTILADSSIMAGRSVKNKFSNRYTRFY